MQHKCRRRRRDTAIVISLPYLFRPNRGFRQLIHSKQTKNKPAKTHNHILIINKRKCQF